MSNSGCGGGPFFLLGFPWVSTDVDELFESPCLNLDTERESLEVRGDVEEGILREGRMSFFCFEAGRISSRSTGTPSETRNRRRVRERIQSGGARGGGATSWDQRDADRGVVKVDESFDNGGKGGRSSISRGKRLAKQSSVAEITLSGLISSKSGIG